METHERLTAAAARLFAAVDDKDTHAMADAWAALGDLLRDFVPDGAQLARCDVCGRETLHAGAVCAQCSTWPQWQAAVTAAGRTSFRDLS